MFYGCTALTTAPVIYVSTTGYAACKNMFTSCQSLSLIELRNWNSSLAQLASYLEFWVPGVALSGTFKCPAGVGTGETITRGTSACPNGWTVVNI